MFVAKNLRVNLINIGKYKKKIIFFHESFLRVYFTGNVRYNSAKSPANKNFCQIIQSQLEDIKTAGTYKKERVIVSPQSSSIEVQGSQGKILNFCANNYLGLSVCKDV